MSDIYSETGVGSSSASADPSILQRLMLYIHPPPSPVPQALQNGGPPIPPNSGAVSPPFQPNGGSGGGAGASPPIGPSILPQARGLAVPPDPSNPTPWFNSGNTPMPWNGPNAPMPPPRPSPVAGGGGVGGGGAIPAGATASVPTATPGMPGMIDRMNASAQMGQPARGYQTAGDFSRFFGMPSDVNPPANPTAPVRGGVLAKGGMSNAPWNVGPQQKGHVFPSEMGPKRGVRGPPQDFPGQP